MAAASLARYKAKRDFKKTSEPGPLLGKKQGFHYLIQKHAATRLHYDFRLELDGVLKSWAVTRGPSLDPQDKRLAVEVEDHPVAYGGFEGTIPKGQYGGGTVMLWDQGTWEPIGDPRKALIKGKLEFKLYGKRLQGEWTLVRMRGREKDKGRNNWLLIKRTDQFAKAGDKDRLLVKNDTSVKSGRSMEEIASKSKKVWQSKPRESAKEKPTKLVRKKSTSTLPAFKPPELATLTDEMPGGKDWVHEIKFDGYRGLAYLQNGRVTIYTRTAQDWTHKFQPIADALSKLPVGNAIIDGEIVALNEEGVSSFKALQNRLSEGESNELQYYAFDLLHLDGKDLTKLPLLERKAKLEALLAKKKFSNVFYSEHFTRDKDFLSRACAMQLEGVISKRADSTYVSGRGKAWLKTKCHKRQEFVIGGFTYPTHEARGVGALLIGYYEEEQFIYAGKVGTGFDQETSMDVRRKLDKLLQKTSPFVQVPADGRRGAHWVKPQLVCEVEFTEWTGEGRLRHPSFQGLREDKPAKNIKRDVSVPIKKLAKQKETRTTKVSSKDAVVSGIRISHPDRVIYPGTKITKQELAEYYAQVAEAMLPHVEGRPLSMVRCPEGTGDPCFFQRHIAKGQSPYLHETGIKVKGRNESYMMIRDVKGLLTLVQWGVIELHPWGCKVDAPDKPDRIIFDLDPDPAVPFKTMVEAAKEIRERMKEFGLESFLKTTGGKGLHVTIPIARQYPWPVIKGFARAVAESMAHDQPSRFVSNMSKEKRKGKIFVDYLRNELTSTAVAPFSARAREGATVATPLHWKELTASLKPKRFTVQTVPLRLQKMKSDPWEDFFTLRQSLPRHILQALKITG